MALKVEDLSKIHSEFPDIYNELFEGAIKRSNIALSIKKEVIDNIVTSSRK